MLTGFLLALRVIASALESIHRDNHERHRELIHLLTELKGLLMSTQEDVNALTATVTAMSEKFDTFDASLTELTSDSAEIKSDLDTLVALVSQPSIDVTQLQSAVAALQAKQDAFTSKFTDAVNAVHTDAGIFTPTPPAGTPGL
jgi:chromosome segregation ATPase